MSNKRRKKPRALPTRKAHEFPLAYPFKLPDRRTKQLPLTLQEVARACQHVVEDISNETTDTPTDRLNAF